jgi:hypothetical protein
MGLFWRRGQSEHVFLRPAETFGLATPFGQETATVRDGSLPMIGLDMVRAASLKGHKSGFKSRGGTT